MSSFKIKDLRLLGIGITSNGFGGHNCEGKFKAELTTASMIQCPMLPWSMVGTVWPVGIIWHIVGIVMGEQGFLL